MNNNQHILDLISSKSILNVNKKESSGQVFTPNKIIIDMISTIPDEIWNNKNLKWLDPTSGIGNFMIIIYLKLMKNLSHYKELKDDKIRSKHIIKNMLFMNELDKESIETTKDLFYILDKDSIINIKNTNFLDYTTDDKYDIIVENPPYNIGGTKEKGQKNVFVFFAVKSLQLLKDNGYLLIIHPSSYRLGNYKPRGTKINLNNIYTKYQIHNICLFTIIQTYELMNVQINVDYILLQKCDKYKLTLITDIYGYNHFYDISPNITIPNFGFNIIDKIKNLCNKYGNIYDLVYRTSELHHENWKKGKVEIGKYPIIHLLKNQRMGHNNNILMSNIKHTHQNTPKIIINSLGVKYVFLDKEGIYGVTDSPFIILSSSQKLFNLLNSSLFNYIVNTISILGNNLNVIVFKFIPNIHDIKDDINIYNLLKLTNEEINTIEKYNCNNIQNIKMKDRKK
jgi:hypothetical protein